VATTGSDPPAADPGVAPPPAPPWPPLTLPHTPRPPPQVWTPFNNKFYETLSYLPPLSENEIARRVD